MAVGWTVAATADANRRTPCIPILQLARKLSGLTPLFNSPLTSHQSLWQRLAAPCSSSSLVNERVAEPFPDMAGRERWQEGPKAKYDMETFDEVLVKASEDFM